MALGRPVWSGHIRLSLVTLPVKLYSATESSARPQLRQIHKPSGERIRYEKVVPGVGPVDRDEIVKGFEIDKGDYVLLSDDDLEAIQLESRKTLELVQFVDACEIDPIYFDKPYYVVPDGELAEEGFVVVREALKRTKKIGLGQIVMRNREYIGAIKPCNRGLMMETLHFEDELRKTDPYFAEIPKTKPGDEPLQLAEELIERKTKPFDASAFKDQYASALKDLIAEKAKGRDITKVKSSETGGKGAEVVDLMAALKKSLGDDKKGSRPGSKSGSKSKTASSRKSGSGKKAA